MSFLQRVKRANRAGLPEDSVVLRSVVLVAVMAAVVGLVVEEVAGGVASAMALVAIPAGFALSHRFRTRDLFGLKAALAVGLVLVLMNFFAGLGPVTRGDFARVQVPLAELFLWVQVLHSMHVPSRRDLMFSLVASGVTFAVTAVVSVSLRVAPFLAVWVVATVVALALGYRRSLVAHAGEVVGSRSRPRFRTLAVTPFVVMLVALAAFLVLPAAGTSRAFTFPVELPRSESVGAPGSLSNPTLGAADPKLGRSQRDAIGTREAYGYFGFTDSLDTGIRGRPDETLVMRVRAPGPDFWRAQSFDVWDGRTWTISDETTRILSGGSPLIIPPAVGEWVLGPDEFIQTFYLETAGPNVVFGANRISELYFPDRQLNQLSDGTLRSNVELGAGTVYTVVSARSAATPDLLRAADPLVFGMPEPVAARYLQLPEVPERVVELAAQITADAPTTYDKVRAIEEWMAANTTYTLDIPPLPPGVDATDHYLFQTRQGFCEQIGTSLVVMLRSLGIPARLAVGYTPGERNPFTGLFEVRAYDAHSWAEVWFPGVGWQGFDPTAAVPLSGDGGGFRAGTGLGEWLRARAPWLGTVGAWSMRVVMAAAGVASVGFVLMRLVARRREAARRHWYDAAALRIGRLGAARGRPRRPAETLVEYAQALRDGPIPDPDLVPLVSELSARRFRGLGPDAGLQRELAELEARVPVSAWQRLVGI